MAPQATQLSIRLTEPVVFLTGGQDHERARARRRRAARTLPSNAAASASAMPDLTNGGSRPGSRNSSPAPAPRVPPGSPVLGSERGRSHGRDEGFVPPGPNRASRSRERGRDYSPQYREMGGSRSRSRARVMDPVPEATPVSTMLLTTGSGTEQEALEADEPPPAMLRGLLTLTLSKPTRIRDITLKFRGLSRTDWPEGIGPRRLDVMEETVLVASATTFFSAANLSSERRAASIGPGIRDFDDLQLTDRDTPRGSRRASSMMPTRDSSVGRAYLARDSAIHNAEPYHSSLLSNPPLSRITSSAEVGALLNSPHSAAPQLDLMPASPEPSPPLPGANEPTPSYSEAIASPLNSPSVTASLTRPVLGQHQGNSSESTFATDSSRSPSIAESSDREGYGSAPVLDSIPSVVGSNEGLTSGPATFQSTTSSLRSPLRRTTSASQHTLASTSTPPPTAVKPPSSSRLSKSGARFSLAGLTDTLRGKSSSRTRAPSFDFARGSSSHRRSESPETAFAARDQSRGRKTTPITTTSSAHRVISKSGWGDEDSDDDENASARARGWREFRAGTYTYPISISVAASLPPSITAEFGHVSYALKATVHRAGALTSNLTTTAEVLLVSCPGQDDTEENESIVVERFWETQMKYHVALSGKSFPVGGLIPISIRLNPLAKVKLYRISAVLEQKTSYFASGRKLTRHEPPKRFPMLRIEHTDPKEPLLPIMSDDPDAIQNHPLADFFINPTSSDDTTPSCLDPVGPWNLESFLKLPDCSTKVTFSTIHDKANINVSHILKVMLRVERGDDDFLDSKGKRKLWDVIIETPIHILSCRCTQNTLPPYSSAPSTSLSAPSSSGFFGAPSHDCGFNHVTNNPTRPSAVSAVQHFTHRSSSANQPAPIATLEQNLLFARLVAGEETPSGEVPPTYAAVISGLPAAGTTAVVMERSCSSESNVTTRGRSGRPTEDEGSRGRSASIVRGVATAEISIAS